MSTDMLFTKDNLNTYLKELGKEFRKRNGTVKTTSLAGGLPTAPYLLGCR